MQLPGCIIWGVFDDDSGADLLFRALADPTRRQLLDRLRRESGQTLGGLCAGLGMTRQSASKHLALLEAAGLLITLRRGRRKLHYLNASPVQEIADRWIGAFGRGRSEALADLKRHLEESSMSERTFAYSTYIRTTPEALWRALTDPAFTLRYWGEGLHSDWQPGSPILLQGGAGEPLRDLGQRVLVAEPYRRLSYTWHNYQPEHAEFFRWSPEYLAELQREPTSQVSFEIEDRGGFVKLTLLHEALVPGSEMMRAVSGGRPETGGWPEILANLKSLLETGEVMVP